MKKVTALLTFLFLLLCVSGPVQAYQYSLSYAEISGLNINSDSRFFSAYYGSLSYALAIGSGGEFNDETFFSDSLNSWAEAEISSANASSGYAEGLMSSQAQAEAGGAYGEESSYAMGMTYAGAYGVYLLEAATLTFSFDYYLSAVIGGDGPGYAEAGAGALLGLYYYGFNDVNGDVTGGWIDVAGSFASQSDRGILSLEVDLAPNTFYTIFAGTSAYALATTAPAPVPEPATMLLLGIGMIGIAGVSRRKRLTRNLK